MTLLSAAERKKRLRQRMQKDMQNKGKAPNTGKKAVDPTIFGNVPLYDPKQGEKIDEGTYICRFNILPWIVKSDKNPDPEVQIGDEAYVLQYFVHNNIGPKRDQIVCNQRTYGEKEIICSDYNDLWNKGEKTEARKLKPSYRVAYNIGNPDDPDSEIQIFLVSGKNFHEVLMTEINLFSKQKNENIYIYDIDQGYTIKFRATLEKKDELIFFKFSNFEFEERDPIPESIYERTYPLGEMLIIHSAEEIEQIHKKKEIKEDKISEKEINRKEKPKLNREKEVFPLSEMNVAELRKYIRAQNLNIEITRDKTREEYLVEIKNSTQINEKEKNKEIKEDCPYNHVFGTECDNHAEDCPKCEKWEICVEEYDRIKSVTKE